MSTSSKDAVQGDWRTLEAGRELDALIAEKVMGWVWHHMDRDRWLSPPGSMWVGATEFFGLGLRFQDLLPAYSTDIAAAWQVVEKMREHPNVRYRNLSLVAYCYNRTYATFDSMAFNDYTGETWAEANGEGATPLSICRAALLATEKP